MPIVNINLYYSLNISCFTKIIHRSKSHNLNKQLIHYQNEHGILNNECHIYLAFITEIVSGRFMSAFLKEKWRYKGFNHLFQNCFKWFAILDVLLLFGAVYY